MGLLGSYTKKVGGFYKKGFTLYKTDLGKAGLVAGCGLATGGAGAPACALAASELYSKKASKVKSKQDAAAAIPELAAPSPLAAGLLIGGVLLLAVVAIGASRG